MKAGILYADRITTVSPSYSEEIKTPEFGCGLEVILRMESGKLQGILNGIDMKPTILQQIHCCPIILLPMKCPVKLQNQARIAKDAGATSA